MLPALERLDEGSFDLEERADEFPPLTPSTAASTPRARPQAKAQKQPQRQKQQLSQPQELELERDEPKASKCFLSEWLSNMFK